MYRTFYFCESILFLFVFVVTVWQPLLPQFIYSDILNGILSKSANAATNSSSYAWLCRYCGDECFSEECYELVESVAQRATSHIMMSVFVVSEVVGVVTSISWSRLSDRRGRRWPMVASCIAQCCFTLILFFFLIYPLIVKKWCVIGAYFLISTTGGSLGNILIGTVSLISDSSSPRRRTHRLAVNESVMTFAKFLGFSLSGALIRYLGSPFVCLWCVGSFALLTILCMLLPKVQTKWEATLRLQGQCKNSRYCSEEKMGPLLWLVIMGRLAFVAPDNFFVIFLMSRPFSFNTTLIGAFLGYKILSLSVICLLYALMPSLAFKTKDTHMIALGLFFLVLSYIFFMVSSTQVFLFLGATLYGMYGLSAVSLNSLLSKSVPESQLAQTFATVKGIERLLCCVAAPLISLIFQATRNWQLIHGFCFLVPLILSLVTGLVLVVYWKQFRCYTLEFRNSEVSPLHSTHAAQKDNVRYCLTL